MIEKMSHYTFLVYHRDYTSFLEQIQQLGVIHVIPTGEGKPAADSSFQASLKQTAHLGKILKEMKQVLKQEDINGLPMVKEGGDMASISVQWQEISSQIETEQKNLHELDKEIKEITPWGDFSHKNIDALTEAGWVTRFWITSPKKMSPAWKDEYNAFVIEENKKAVYFITITPTAQQVDIPAAREVTLSPSPISTLIILQTRAKDNLKRLLLQQEDVALAHYREVESAYLANLNETDLQQIELSTAGEAENKVMLFEGWVPNDGTKQLDTFLDSEGIYYQKRKATPDDNAPIKLKNNRINRLFEPITKLYDMPAYGEWDLTPLFAPFFVMFFGLCLGDAGYGLLLLAIGLIGYFKMPKLRSIMLLVCIMGGGTCIFGTLTGTFFGVSLIKETLPNGERIMQWDWLDSMKNVILDSNQLFYASLLIGIFQIIIGMIVKAIRYTLRYGLDQAIPTWGWLSIILGCGGAAALQHFGKIDADTARWCYYIFGGIGVAAVFLLNNLKRNPLINIGAGIWDTYNMASGLLGDILSYVRLFALGISGAVLGLVFNNLAMQAAGSWPVIGWIAPAIILIFGHGINIFMSGLGAFVHPMRLTFVELYKNAGFEGGGKIYQPFRQHMAND